MNDHHWQTTRDPRLLLMYPGDQGSLRKGRLFACACCRHVWSYLTDPRSREAVEVAERFAEGLASRAELKHAKENALAASRETTLAGRVAYAAVSAASPTTPIDVLGPALGAARAASLSAETEETEAAWHCRLLRDLYHSPFRRITLESDWLLWGDGIVKQLAETAYTERIMPGGTLDNARLAVLADALEDAGCDNADILNHCREEGAVHVRGCFVLDLVLGKA
jgi:hypothetical protein